MKFKFKAIKNGGGTYEDIKESVDKNTLYEELKAEGDTLLFADEIKKSKWNKEIAIFNSVPEQQKIVFARNLGSMIKAGLSLAKSLNILEKQITNKRFKKIISSIQIEIKKGQTLSSACSAYQDVFPKLFISMVKAGEEAGTLSDSLQIVANQMDQTYKLKKKVKGAMIYPGIIISVMLVIGILMLIYVVPSITATFRDLKVELPFFTRILIDTSDFLKNNILVTLLTVIAIVIAFYLGLRSKAGKKIFDAISLRLPVIGEIVKETNAARMTRTISSLLSSGVAYNEAISITRDVVQNEYYKEILTEAMSKVEKGGSISSVFMEKSKICPIFVSEMAVVGEETGNLPSMFMEVALFYEDSVDQKTKNMSTIIEPVLMVVIGLAVGVFALAIIKPIYSLSSSI